MGAIRELPSNTEAERGILGIFLHSHELFIEYRTSLTPAYFYAPAHRTIFEAMLQADQGGQSVELVTIATILLDQGKLEQVGGGAMLSALMSEVFPNRQDLKAWVDIVIDKALRRNLIKMMSKATAAAYQGQETPEDIAEQLLRDMRQGMQSRTKAVGVSEVVAETLNEISDRTAGRKAPGLMCRYHDLNKMIYGLHKSDLIILAARPSMGKTTLAVCIGKDIALTGARVLVFSLEMKSTQLAERMLSEESGVPLEGIRTGNLEPGHRVALERASQKIARLPLKIDDQAGLSIGQLQARAKTEAFKDGVDLIIVDYLQLLNAPGAQNREREVSLISAGLKQLAKDLDVPVLALSQLNRSLESRTDPTPRLSDLRDSGSIEQDADVIAFINRPKNGDKGPMAGRAELIVAKHRNGATGNLYLKFEGYCCRFSG